jgi:hypothetical protein
MGRNLLIVGLAALILVGSPRAKEVIHPDDMEFIEFLGTFEKDVDPLMLPSMSELKKVPPKSPQKGSSYEKKNTKQKDATDE